MPSSSRYGFFDCVRRGTPDPAAVCLDRAAATGGDPDPKRTAALSTAQQQKPGSQGVGRREPIQSNWKERRGATTGGRGAERT